MPSLLLWKERRKDMKVSSICRKGRRIPYKEFAAMVVEGRWRDAEN